MSGIFRFAKIQNNPEHLSHSRPLILLAVESCKVFCSCLRCLETKTGCVRCVRAAFGERSSGKQCFKLVEKPSSTWNKRPIWSPNPPMMPQFKMQNLKVLIPDELLQTWDVSSSFPSKGPLGGSRDWLVLVHAHSRRASSQQVRTWDQILCESFSWLIPASSVSNNQSSSCFLRKMGWWSNRWKTY